MTLGMKLSSSLMKKISISEVTFLYRMLLISISQLLWSHIISISPFRKAIFRSIPQGYLSYSARLSVLFREAICSFPRGYLSRFRCPFTSCTTDFHSLYVWGDCKSLHICIHPAHEPVLLLVQPCLVRVITLCHHGRDALFRIGACNKALIPEPS